MDRELLAGPVAALAVVMLLILAWFGRRLMTARPSYVEVDPQSRTIRIVRDGVAGAPQSMEAFGPLTISVWSRRRTVIFSVHPARLPDFVLARRRTRLHARRDLEKFARILGTPAGTFETGPARDVAELDLPLHARLRSDPEAMRPVAFRPEDEVTLVQDADGAMLKSSRRSFEAWAGAFLLLATPLFVAWIAYAPVRALLDAMRNELRLDRDAKVALAVIAIPFAIALVRGVYRLVRASNLLPVRVSRKGLSYGGRTMPLEEIEEIDFSLGIDVIGDRRAIHIPDSFCRRDALPLVVHELRRLVVHHARNPL